MVLGRFVLLGAAAIVLCPALAFALQSMDSSDGDQIWGHLRALAAPEGRPECYRRASTANGLQRALQLCRPPGAPSLDRHGLPWTGAVRNRPAPP